MQRTLENPFDEKIKSNRRIKRVFDLVLSLTVLIISSPLWVVVAILVKVTTPGPVFIAQGRIGKGFLPSKLWRFRTVVGDPLKADSDIASGTHLRITKIGYLLRAFKLDGLPQLFNILKGEVSLVGPRPEDDKYVELFQKDYQIILTVPPGITDLASIEFRDESSLLAQSDDPETCYINKVLPRSLSE
ncbi:MAG: sugar transferase [Nitrospirae bacterium]|nr:sugar transferase [Nitrospirota bacterium]